MRTAEYLPAVVAVLVSAGVGAAVSLFAGRFGPNRRAAPGSAKGLSFEGGGEALGDAHAPMALRLYPMLLAFLVFDMAVALLLPWAMLVGQRAWRPGPACAVAADCVPGSNLWAAGLTFAVVLLVAWLHVRGTRAGAWNS
ncbi:MAG: NADH-quinone oxidoreductase subunit A [Deltaproteobacteria bacterium]|nr:NADH-quinone oxidoreductase subunit A [Deltaproteobacteria bacterium]